LALMSRLRVPVIAVITGEGNSGGALALGVADRMLMLENAYYAVLSPEGFASILWKDPSRRGEACDVMKLTAQDLMDLGVIDEIIPEPVGGAQRDTGALYAALDAALCRAIESLDAMSADELTAARYEKYRKL
jgi:acetyl-CoA carboxylase carboxyl transferase subunit alpha